MGMIARAKWVWFQASWPKPLLNLVTNLDVHDGWGLFGVEYVMQLMIYTPIPH